MTIILVKGIFLNGRKVTPADKYIEPSSKPHEYDLQDTYKTINGFLKEKALPIIPRIVRHLPFIDDGFITASAAASCYSLNQCIIFNQFVPHFNGVFHIIQSVAKLEEEHKIDELFEDIKDRSGLKCTGYWEDYGERKKFDFKGKWNEILLSGKGIVKLLNK